MVAATHKSVWRPTDATAAAGRRPVRSTRPHSHFIPTTLSLCHSVLGVPVTRTAHFLSLCNTSHYLVTRGGVYLCNLVPGYKAIPAPVFSLVSGRVLAAAGPRSVEARGTVVCCAHARHNPGAVQSWLVVRVS